jgi:hypothetical protein
MDFGKKQLSFAQRAEGYGARRVGAFLQHELVCFPLTELEGEEGISSRT